MSTPATRRVAGILASIGTGIAAVIIWLLVAALIGFFVVGGMFYRTACPSHVSWTFNPLPFFYVVKTGDTACSTDTATGYYTGKVPLVGRPLRTFVKSWTGQDHP